VRIEGFTDLAVPKASVWGFLTDPEMLATLLPEGVVLAEDDTTWQARLSPPTALGNSPFRFTLTLLEQRPEEYVRIAGHGRSSSQNVVDLTARIDLSERDGGTEVRWESDVRPGGVLASLGQRSLQYVVRQQIEDVLRTIEKRHSEVPA